MVQRSGENLLAIISDILDFSKIEAGKMDLETISFSLPGTIKRILALLSKQARAKGLPLTFSSSPGIAEWVRGDPTRLGQVLTNLLGNAIKFTDFGEVSLCVSPVEECSRTVLLRFEVKDTGIGIPAEAHEMIFQSFAQADGSMTRKYGGTGLGLAISKQLVEKMNGNIGVESQLGTGSLFWFTVRLEKTVESSLESVRATKA